MCGIAGIIGERAAFDSEALLHALDHRGPDRQAAVTPSDGVWLAATRLAIRDLSAAGNQPMSTNDGALTIVHNGEIYNARELRRELVSRGHAFRSTCDTEVILHGFREWGDAVVEHLEGMFVFGIWDRQRRRCFLARDPLGIKPLYLVRLARGLAFSSEVRALLLGKLVARSLSAGALASFLATGSVSEPSTIVRGVEAVPPGSWLAYEDGRYQSVRYWHPPAHEEELPPAQASALVRERLDAAVHGCLESDVPVALLLSGGIDSAALAIIARSHAQLETFHVRVGDAAADRAATLARDLGLRYREVRVTPAEAEQALVAAVAAQDQPSIDGSNVYLVSRAIREAGFKVALTGLGADEIFVGYSFHPSYMKVRAAQRALGAAVSPLRALAAQVPSDLMEMALGRWRGEKLHDLVTAGTAAASYAAARALFPEASRRALQAELPARPPERVLTFDGSAAGELSRLEISGYLVNTLLRDADVMSMAHGVELRVPMLDRRLVETVLGLGPALKVVAGKKKPLLVSAVPELPASFSAARKEGFELPLERWLLGAARPRIETTLLSASELQRVGLEPRAVRQIWDGFLSAQDRPSAYRIWGLFVMTQWAAQQRMSL